MKPAASIPRSTPRSSPRSTLDPALSLALLRGINVGGKNLLPMKKLAEFFADAGCSDVRTYIQSGNVVFKAPANLLVALPETIGRSIANEFAFRVPVVLRTAEELGEAIRGNPYLADAADPKTLHIMFLANAPSASAVVSLDAARSLPDSFAVRGRTIYLNLPNGVARSKLTNAYFDSRLSTTSTMRNWATVLKLAEWMGIREA